MPNSVRTRPVPVGIVDYGTGNIASLEKALFVVGASPSIVRQPPDLVDLEAVILPGVGHFGPASAALHESGLARELTDRACAGFPLLGICLGLQLLTAASEESPGASGLGLLPLASQRLRPHNTYLHKVPHLGWNTIHTDPTGTSSRLLHGIASEQQPFYFANAYAIARNQCFSTIQATYRHERSWLGLIEHRSICGVQFHPEKSRAQGLQLLRNFLGLVAECH